MRFVVMIFVHGTSRRSLPVVETRARVCFSHPDLQLFWHSLFLGVICEGATARGIGYPNCKDIQSSTQISNALHFFVQSRAALKAAFLQRLEEMRATLSESDWFLRREVRANDASLD